MAGDDAVAGDDLVLHAEVAAAVRDELVQLFERAGIEQEIDALARRELAGVVLALEAGLAAAELREPLEIGKARHTRAVWAFSQSFRNFSSPMSVSGCLKQASITAAGHVQMCAPSRAACTMCIG